MRLSSLIVMASVLTLLATVPVTAAQIYDFTFTGNGGMNATGTITIDSGVATDGSISVTGVPVEADPSTLISSAGNLLPGSGVAKNRNGDYCPYDNLVNLANDPILTGNGVDFVAGQYNPDHYNTLINLWGGDPYGNPVPGEYTLFVGEAQMNADGTVAVPEYVYHWESGSLTLTPAPEPASLSLLALGGLAMLRRRK